MAAKKPKKSKYDGTKTIAVILIRGTIGTMPDVRATLTKLKLFKKNNCTLVKNTESNIGMLFRVKDYVTYGEITEELVKKLEAKGDKDKDGNVKPHFRLNPPKGGFERKGIKKSYSIGGALGHRGKEMPLLIEKML